MNVRRRASPMCVVPIRRRPTQNLVLALLQANPLVVFAKRRRLCLGNPRSTDVLNSKAVDMTGSLRVRVNPHRSTRQSRSGQFHDRECGLTPKARAAAALAATARSCRRVYQPIPIVT